MSQARTWISNVAWRGVVVFKYFTLAFELMNAAIKNYTSINGIKINNSEYLLSQYANDSSRILDGCDDSLRKYLYILEKFSECAGLNANLEKLKPYGLGQKYTQMKDYCQEKN